MNEENKKENIREEINRANESMKAADLLFENGFVRDAVAKLYPVRKPRHLWRG